MTDLTDIDALAAGIAAELPTVDPIIGPDDVALVAPNLPATFWEARPKLAHIRQAAHARMLSADAVLGAVLARVALAVPPTVSLPAIVGGPGTFDLIVALIGGPGAGKSAAAEIAEELLPIEADDITELSLGSGEGLIESYFDWVTEEADGKKTKVKRQTKRGVLFTLDEGQVLLAQKGRQGTTIMETLRSAWSGKRLGQANASQETKRQLGPGLYRFALLVGFQLEYAAGLIGDAAGGTPQRFIYLAATDPEIPDTTPEWPGKVTWRQTYTIGAMHVDDVIAAEIRAAKLSRTREDTGDGLDAHRNLLRLKVAGLLAILDGHRGVEVDDWALAGEILDSSDRVRQGIIDAAKSRRNFAERASIASADRRAAALDNGAAERALTNMARAVANHVHRGQCDNGCHRACTTRATASRDRKLATVDAALDRAVIEGWIVRNEDRLMPGETVP